ncbi:peptidoglycan editing factor PgeF [soil metagenome]
MFRARGHVRAQAAGRFDIEWAVTDRLARASGPDQFFTLGGSDPGHAAVIAANRAELTAELGLLPGSLRFMKQVHGSDVALVRGSSHAKSVDPTCDAMVTDDRSIALAVLVADCTPVLLWDAGVGCVGAVHAGRAGMLSGLVTRCVERMRSHGASSVHALVGPSICGRCYEVPPQLRDEAARVQPATVTVSWAGTPAIDIAAGVVAALSEVDVPVQWLSGCTRESTDLFSHRADPGAGRFAAIVRVHDRAGTPS